MSIDRNERVATFEHFREGGHRRPPEYGLFEHIFEGRKVSCENIWLYLDGGQRKSEDPGEGGNMVCWENRKTPGVWDRWEARQESAAVVDTKSFFMQCT